jgi:hypothetical protein
MSVSVNKKLHISCYLQAIGGQRRGEKGKIICVVAGGEKRRTRTQSREIDRDKQGIQARHD